MNNPLFEREVGMSECLTTRRRLTTGGASTCIVLAALNHETNSGLLGHFTHDDSNEFIDESLEAVTHLGPGGSTEVRLAGSGIYFSDGVSYPESAELNKAFEERVKAMAKKHGIPLSSITVSWLWGNDEANVEVDCDKGTITVNEELGRIGLI